MLMSNYVTFSCFHFGFKANLINIKANVCFKNRNPLNIIHGIFWGGGVQFVFLAFYLALLSC